MKSTKPSMIFVSIVSLIGCASAVAAEPIINLSDIALKQKSDVQKSLGNPSKCENVKHGEKCLYKKELVEVVYIGGKADWITINHDGFPYSPEALPMLGLEIVKPTVANKFTVSWSGVTHTTEADATGTTKFMTLALIQLNVGAPGKVDSVYVKVATK